MCSLGFRRNPRSFEAPEEGSIRWPWRPAVGPFESRVFSGLALSSRFSSFLEKEGRYSTRLLGQVRCSEQILCKARKLECGARSQ